MGGPPGMMGGPPGMMMQEDIELSQKIEEWDDNIDQPIKTKEEEIIENILEEQDNIEDDDIEDDDIEDNNKNNDIESDEGDSDEGDSDEGDSDDDSDDGESDDNDEGVEISTNNPDTKIISLVDSSFSVKQLQGICKEKNLSVSGNKTQLINRINSH
tara:strand:- start:913 stop:1383 length:471 start_codon:yes stop_codon:yes gene_type:complete